MAGSKHAVVLLALGTPSEPTVPAVRRFLRAFLGDERVIALPWFFRKLLLECIILPFRAKHSATMYRKIWTAQGSPFAVHTEALRKRIAEELGENIPVRVAMRYGEPPAEKVVRELADSGVQKIVVLPQFPQYAESSRETAVVHFSQTVKTVAPGIRLHVAPPFYAESGYIEALAETLHGIDRSRNFVFSFHGIPLKSLVRVAAGKTQNCDLSDTSFSQEKCKTCEAAENCYRRQCYATAFALAEKADIPADRVQVAFQSRFGKGKWLVPATADCVDCESVLVAPGFTVDCVETLLELRNLNPQTLVPCLNDSPAFARFLAAYAKRSQTESENRK